MGEKPNTALLGARLSRAALRRLPCSMSGSGEPRSQPLDMRYSPNSLATTSGRAGVHHLGLGIVGRRGAGVEQGDEAVHAVDHDPLHPRAGLETMEMRLGLAEGEDDLVVVEM